MNRKSATYVAFSLFAFLISACLENAPHENPIDPQNGTRVAGSIFRYYRNDPIPGAVIRLTPGNHIAVSASDGSYLIDNVTVGEYEISCSGEGYLDFTDQISVQQSEVVDIRLDALPQIVDVSMITHHEAVFFGPDDYYMEIEVRAIDQDQGDIDLVRYEISQIAFADTMVRRSTGSVEELYLADLNSNTAGIGSLHELVGKSFIFYVEDFPGATNQSNRQLITRIIDETPQIESPKDSSVSVPFDFQWLPSAVTFDFRYRIDILLESDIGIQTAVDSIVDIDPDSTKINYNNTINPGEYIWVLYIVDEFGNRSRSRLTPFRVQPSAPKE